MGNYKIFEGLENPRRDRQARNFTTNVPKIQDLKSSSEQIFFKNRRWVPLSRVQIHDHARKIAILFAAYQLAFNYLFHYP